MFDATEYKKTTVLPAFPDQAIKTRLGLLYEVGIKVGSFSRLERLIEQITQMTQRTLNASASSVLLLNEEERELLFEVAAGPAGKVLRQIRLGTDYGIAAWVALNCKPLIVNDVTRDERFNKKIDKITGFVTKSIICAPLVVHRRVIGVIEVLNRLDGSDFNGQDMETLVSVASTAAMAIENTRLHQAAMDAYKNTIKALAAAIDAKDPYTRGHSQRVMEYALLGGTSLLLPEEELEVLEYAGVLHDVGKIVIADSILKKPDSLTPGEWTMVREHPVIGANMVKEIPFLKKASKLIRYHHERYDGSGYPDGLKGEEIPLGARLLAVADAFDSMTTDRAYHPALTVEYTISELHGCTGTQFCPVAVEAFISGLGLHPGKSPSSNLPPALAATGR